MAEDYSRLLSYYAKFSKDFLLDIASLESDVEFEEGGGQIIYAVDFSELYAYSRQSSEQFFSSRKSAQSVLDDEREWLGSHALLVELHEMLMQFIVFRVGPALLLLDPYIVELRNYMHNLRLGVVRGTLKYVGEAINASKDPDYDWARELARQPHLESGRLTDLDAKRLSEFIARAAPSFLAESGEIEGGALERLQHISRSGRIVTWDELLQIPQRPDDEAFKQWSDALNQRRKGREFQNEVDALAVATLTFANGLLNQRDQPRRLRLVTRSPVMLDILRGGLVNSADPHLIRHPRAFLALLDQNGQFEFWGSSAAKKRALELWRRTFERLQRIETDATGAQGDLTHRELVRRQLAVITEAWRRSCRIPLAQHVLARGLNSENKLVAALKELTSADSVRLAIRTQVSQLLERLNEGHMSLGISVSDAFMQALAEKRRVAPLERSPSVRILGVEDKRIVLRAVHGTPMAFEIAIQSPRLCDVVAERGGDPIEVLNFLMRDDTIVAPVSGNVPTDEWYLVLAYTAGAIGSWEVTDEILKLIRDMKTMLGLEPQLSAIAEARYLAARTARYLDKDTDELEKAANDLALNLAHSRVALTNERERFDFVRYRSEHTKLRCVIYAKLLDHSEPDRSDSFGKSLREEISVIVSDKRAFQSGRASCNLLNTLCYHAVELDRLGHPIMGIEPLASLFEKFVIALTGSYGSDNQGWPDNYADTFVWTSAHLGARAKTARGHVGAESDQYLREIAERLVKYEYLGNLDQKEFRVHLRMLPEILAGGADAGSQTPNSRN